MKKFFRVKKMRSTETLIRWKRQRESELVDAEKAIPMDRLVKATQKLVDICELQDVLFEQEHIDALKPQVIELVEEMTRICRRVEQWNYDAEKVAKQWRKDEFKLRLQAICRRPVSQR